MRILIIIVVIIGFGAVIGSIVVGQRVFEGKVVDKPYERGLEWDRVQREKAELGWRVDIKNKFKAGNNEIMFSVLDKKGNQLKDIQVSLTISRPATTAYDREFGVLQVDGVYKSVVNFPLHGNWDLKININENGRNIILEKRIFAEQGDK